MNNIYHTIITAWISILLIPQFILPQTFTTSNLPIVLINTRGQVIVNEPKITVDFRIIENGNGKRNAVTDTVYHYNGVVGIEIRGSSSQMFPKKQYGFETRDSSGNDVTVSLLGMPAESDWILSAQYNDKTLMRDALVYSLSNSIGRYASRSRYCEVVINGQYQGVYMLFEKIKRDKNRVNVSKLDATVITGDALTGGYIIKIDKLDGSGNDGWYSNFPPQPGSRFKILYQYHYPKPEDIVPEQKTYLKNFVLNYEAILFSPSYADSAKGYSQWLDVPSMIDFFLLNEMTKNVDAYRLSVFMYKDKDSKNPKLHFGPIWDHNHGFGNCDYYEASKVNGWQLTYLTSNNDFMTKDEFQVPFWWKKILQDTFFVQQAAVRWEHLRKNILTREKIYRFVDSVSTLIDEGQKRNFVKWPILNVYVWPNAYVGGSYANEIAYLKEWIKYRLEWMDLTLSGKLLEVEHLTQRIPSGIILHQNYPNPFNPETTIEFQLPDETVVELSLYNIVGQKIKSVVNGPMSRGFHSVKITADELVSGLYFYRLTAGEYSAVKAMTVLK